MESGRLRHRIRLETPASVQDGYGDPVPTWALQAVTWAEVSPLVGRERFAAQQVEGEVDHRVRLRYQAGLGPTLRVVWQGRRFDVKAVLNLGERNEELELLCTEAVG